ncbi:hypothetical protein ACQPYK_29135 [Streptosporangium sp. CA-135522]|uniref:hypothetical protein n=1 Tax=Streptosporangium sp. CA-135522 TaxID=3240072 RepID=UPI003D8C562B
MERHPEERAFVESWPQRLAVDGTFYRDSGFVSALLRRVRLLHGTNIDYWKMWMNANPYRAYDVHLLWANGGENSAVIDRLRDPLFGLDLALTPLKEPPCQCGPDMHCCVKLIHRGAGHRLFLRRSIEARRSDDDHHSLMGTWMDSERHRRAQMCATYRY